MDALVPRRGSGATALALPDSELDQAYSPDSTAMYSNTDGSGPIAVVLVGNTEKSPLSVLAVDVKYIVAQHDNEYGVLYW